MRLPTLVSCFLFACGEATNLPAADASGGSQDASPSHDVVDNDTSQPTDPGPFEWPVPTAPVAVPEDPAWRPSVELPFDPFVSALGVEGGTRWVKFTVLLRDPSRVYFQDSNAFPFHQPFASQKLPPFLGLDPAAFDAVTLRAQGQEAILGALLLPAEPTILEYGVQLVGHDPYHPELVRRVVELVRAAVFRADSQPGGPGGAGSPDQGLTAFYMPTFEQAPSATVWREWLAERGVEVTSPDRWSTGDQCYAQGWALGRLVEVAGGELDAAYAAGRLTEEDILLTDGVPAEIPFVAGVVSLSPSTPSSHVAILSTTYGVPFVHVATAEARAAAKALVGETVYMRTRPSPGTSRCIVDLVTVEGIPDQDLTSLVALKTPPPLGYPVKEHADAALLDCDGLGPADASLVGGKASNFGLLRDAIPANSPKAWAIPFDLWGAVMAGVVDGERLSDRIRAMLAPFEYPVQDLGALFAALAEVRALIEDRAEIPGAAWLALQGALSGAFDPTVRLRFRSSTNVEDGESFTGAGLYESHTGCLADDLDADDGGPSACQPERPTERPARRAILETFASFYNNNAYLERLRRGVVEHEVGMALLVHPSFPDEIERANGVATVAVLGAFTEVTLVSQAGAVSITNPDTTATPEVLRVAVWPSLRSLTWVQSSSLTTLGEPVLGTQERIEALVDLVLAVRDRWLESHPENPGPVLDLEYKAVGDDWDLVVKQVRAIPRPESKSLVPYLRPGTLELCTFQGDHGTPLGTHRSKMRWRLELEARRLDSPGLAKPLATARLEVADEGSVRTFEDLLAGAEHEGGPLPAEVGAIETRDKVDLGVARSVTLRIVFPGRRPFNEGPLVLPGDLALEAVTRWPPPRPTGLDWEPFTQEDSAALLACPEVTPDESPRTVQATAGGVTVTTEMRYQQALKGIQAGYTAPLGDWLGTTIVGLTPEPIALSSWWSQSFRPEHHNFSEWFIFEPRLDPSVPAATLAALEARGLSGLIVLVGDAEPLIQGLDLSGAPVALK